MNSWLTGNYDYGSSPDESPPTPPDNPVHTQHEHNQQHDQPQQHQNNHQNQPQTLGHHPQQNQGQHHPQQNQGQHHPQQNQGQHHPQQNQGQHHPKQNQGQHHPQQNHGHHNQQSQGQHQLHQTHGHHNQQGLGHPVAPIVQSPPEPRPSQAGQSNPQQQPLAKQQPASYHHQKEVQLTQVNYPENPAKQLSQTQQLQGSHPPPPPPQFPMHIPPHHQEHREMIEEKPQNKQRNEAANKGNAWLFGQTNPDTPAKSLEDDQKYEEELKKRKTKWDFDKEDDEKRKASSSGFINYKDKIVEITKTHEKRPHLMGEGNRIQNGHQVMLGPNGGYQPIPQVPHAGPPAAAEGNPFQVPDGYYKGKIIHDPNFKFMDVTYGPLPSKQRPPHGNKGKRPNDERRKPYERYPKQVQHKSGQASSGYPQPQSAESPHVGGHGEHLMEDPPAEIIYEYGWIIDNSKFTSSAGSSTTTDACWGPWVSLVCLLKIEEIAAYSIRQSKRQTEG
ncbi:unnamed protein product [Orchesella dallaii]|uniref:Uncharacterized protein n=1 Tax=Orchesella dallaii TaxID=48710 RepID=A0ABP1Q3A3_9HEXA